MIGILSKEVALLHLYKESTTAAEPEARLLSDATNYAVQLQTK